MTDNSPPFAVDRLFAEPRLAELYDLWHPWDQRGDFAFYLPLVLAADSVLDVGCGTGELLRLARQSGHAGRLCGLDPAEAMLARARARADIEWVLGTADSAAWDREFDLVVMTGHAFQVLVDDARIRASLAAIAATLTEVGRFAFETRHPLARAWEGWTSAHAVQAVSPSGAVVTKTEQARAPTDGRTVSFTSTYASPDWDHPELSHSTLRFLDPGEVAAFLAEAGLVIETQYGDWDHQPLTDASPEIITIARRP